MRAKSRDLFILGAGFSKAISPGMPTLKELGGRLRERLEFPPNTKGPDLFGGNVELWLSYLAQRHPWLTESTYLRNRAVFLEISSAIREIILDACTNAYNSPFPTWLRGLLGYWAAAEMPVITLNYDTLVELAAFGQPQIGGPEYVTAVQEPPRSYRLSSLVGPQGFRFLKLHGSINWFYSGIETFAGDTVYSEDADLEAKGQVALHDTRLVPMIIPPVADKASGFQNTTIRDQWAAAASYLREADRICVLGYSLPATDLAVRFWLSEVENKEVVVVDCTDDVRAHFPEALGDRFSFNFEFVGGLDCIPRFAESLRI